MDSQKKEKGNLERIKGGWVNRKLNGLNKKFYRNSLILMGIQVNIKDFRDDCPAVIKMDDDDDDCISLVILVILD